MYEPLAWGLGQGVRRKRVIKWTSNGAAVTKARLILGHQVSRSWWRCQQSLEWRISFSVGAKASSYIATRRILLPAQKQSIMALKGLHNLSGLKRMIYVMISFYLGGAMTLFCMCIERRNVWTFQLFFSPASYIFFLSEWHEKEQETNGAKGYLVWGKTRFPAYGWVQNESTSWCTLENVDFASTGAIFYTTHDWIVHHLFGYLSPPQIYKTIQWLPGGSVCHKEPLFPWSPDVVAWKGIRTGEYNRGLVL